MMEEPDDDGYRRPEDLLDDGWLDEDTVNELRDLLKHVEWEPTPGSKSNAALVLIDHILNPPKADAPVDPSVTWAKLLLDRK